MKQVKSIGGTLWSLNTILNVYGSYTPMTAKIKRYYVGKKEGQGYWVWEDDYIDYNKLKADYEAGKN